MVYTSSLLRGKVEIVSNFKKMGEYAMTVTDNNPNQPVPQISRPKNSMRLILMIVALVVILLVAGSILAYAKFDVFKSAKMIYLQSELENMGGTHASFSSALKNYNEEVQPLLDKPVHSVYEISDFMFDTAQQDEQTKKVLDFVKKSTLMFDIAQDTKNNKSFGKFNWNFGSDSLIGIEAAIDSEKISFRIPALYDKYGYVQVKDMDELKKQFNSNNLPKKMVTYKDLVNAVSIKQEELAAILVPYGKLYAESIDAKQVTLNKSGLMEEEGARIKSRELTVTFNENDVKRLMHGIADKLGADQALQDLVYSRYKNVNQLFNDSGYPTKDISRDDFNAAWKKYIEQMKKSVDNGDFSDGATMIVYIDGNHQILERKMTINVKENGKKNVVTIKSAAWKDNNSPNQVLFSIESKSEKGDGGAFKVLSSSNIGTNGGKGKLGVSLNEYGGSTADAAFALDLDYDVTTSKDKDSGSYNFNISIPGNGKDTGTVKGSLTSTTAKSENTKDANYEVKLNFSGMKFEDQVKAISFKLHNKQDVGAEVKLPELTKDNSIDLTHLSDEARYQLLQDVGVGVQAFMTKHRDLLQSIGVPYGGMEQPGTGINENLPLDGEMNDLQGDFLDEGTNVN
jgi:hypothetical protein